MGYKNINMSRDVDQSYMLKGSQKSNRLSNNSRADISMRQGSVGSTKKERTGSNGPLFGKSSQNSNSFLSKKEQPHDKKQAGFYK